MKPSDLFPKLEGNYGKVCTILLKNGETNKTCIFYGTRVDDFGIMYINVSNGKSTANINLLDIEDIEFELD